MQTAQHVTPSTLRHIPLSLIVPGKNPRKHFDPDRMAELMASVKEKGVLQSITVRPLDNGTFQILAGERRVRAARTALGEEYEIPAIVAEVGDDDAEAISLTENVQREGMSASEESDSAARILSKNRGDAAETAKELGWPLNKLTKRLALQNLSLKVKEALTTQQITLGHAELLATVPVAKQDPALEQIIDHGLSVSFVRTNLLKKVLMIASAIFDQADCDSCQYNTSRQKSLFTENLEVDGNCTNPDCYGAKEKAQVEQIRQDLAEEYPHTRIVGLGDTSFAPLGEEMVGADQFAVCKGCGEYGAAVSTVPGQIGVVTKSLCFSLDCRKEKMAARAKAVKEAQNRAPKPEQRRSPDSKAAKPAPAPKAAAQPRPHALSQKVKDYRRGIWNVAAKKELAASPDRARAFIIDLAINNLLSAAKGMELKAIYKKITGKDYIEANGSISAAIFGLAEELQVKLLTAITVTTVESLSEQKVKQALDLLEVDLCKHFAINRDFLDLLTKSELEALCTEIGVNVKITDYSRIKTGKRDDFIGAILACGVDFKGILPKMLSW